jgi:SAM-dependent methyltransferase
MSWTRTFTGSTRRPGCARERVPDAELKQGDLEEIPFEDDSFDVVTCFNGLQFAEDKPRALAELRRVARPDEHVVVAAFGDYEDQDLRFVFEALMSLLPLPNDAPPPDQSGPFALSEPGLLHEMVEDAGMRVEIEPHVAFRFEYPDLETALRGLLAVGPAIVAERTVGQEAVREAVARAIERFKRDDGSYRLNNMARYVLTHA